MGILAFIKHLTPLSLYLLGILFFLKSLTGDGKWALLLLILLIPLENVFAKVQEFPLGTHFLDILIIGTIVSWFISCSSSNRPLFAPSNLNTIISVLMLYSMISILVGSYYLYGSLYINFSEHRFTDWRDFALMPLLFFITLNYITDKKSIYLVLMAMVFAFIILNYYTVSQIMNYGALASREKITGTFQYLGTNEIAAFYNEYTIIIMGVFFYLKDKKIKLILISLVIVNIFCILGLYSRGAYLGLFAGMFFLFSLKKRILLIPLILVAIFWQNILPEKVVERIKHTTSSSGQLDSSSQERIDIWKQSLDLFKQNPLMGIGYGSFQALGFILGDTHNIYVKYLVEEGLIGFVILLITIFCFFRMGYILYQKGKDELSKGMGLGLMAGIITLIINNFFGNRWSYLEVNAYLWIFTGLVGRLIIINQSSKPMPEVKQKEISTATPIPPKQKKKIRYYDL